MKLITLLTLFCLTLISCVQKSDQASTPKERSTKVACDLSQLDPSLTAPQSIEEVTDLINALPKPLEISCFLKALKRPLYVNATSSILSVQKAQGTSSPRIFIFNGNFIIALLPTGEGSDLLEFSEVLGDVRSIKGEIQFPVMGTISYALPYSRVNNGNQTSCSGCHKGEHEEYFVEGVPVYSSNAIRPNTNKDVPLVNLQHEHYLCDFNQDKTERCEVFRALLDHGEVLPQDFPTMMPTFLENLTP